jgi:hypothetical protein
MWLGYKNRKKRILNIKQMESIFINKTISEFDRIEKMG